MREAFYGLEPKSLWHYFDIISGIPRCSGKEEKVRQAILDIASKKKLETRTDKAGNVVVILPASKGCESSPTVVIQGHMDMVCEKNEATDHDFETQGIEVIRDGEWLRAKGTTLGADNGVAVAAALALIDDPPEKHGELELLFTVDEERGLTGASRIEPHMLKGRLLLNLDSEEEGFVTVGCAGGGDTIIQFDGEREELPEGFTSATITVKGLAGGHSGIDIHENRANAIKCIGRILERIAGEAGDVLIHSIDGGSKRNAIPREAKARIAFPQEKLSQVAKGVVSAERELKDEFKETDPGLLALMEEKPDGFSVKPFNLDSSKKILYLILASPSGVIAMDRNIPGLVETSNNLGVLETTGDTVKFLHCTRSSIKTALEATRSMLKALGMLAGAKVTLEEPYPGWKPDLSSRLLQRFKQVHKEVTGKEPEVIAIHAGLECGILGERFEGMEMISFGPEMEAVHSPDERLNIPSTQRFFKLLKKLLEALA